MYGRRVEKYDLRVETYGTVDELNAALGMARAQAKLPLVTTELLLIQNQLVALMGELAVAPQDAERYAKDKYPKLTPEMLQHLDDLVAKIEGERGLGGAGCGAHDMPPRGAVSGEAGIDE